MLKTKDFELLTEDMRDNCAGVVITLNTGENPNAFVVETSHPSGKLRHVVELEDSRGGLRVTLPGPVGHDGKIYNNQLILLLPTRYPVRCICPEYPIIPVVQSFAEVESPPENVPYPGAELEDIVERRRGIWFGSYCEEFIVPGPVLDLEKVTLVC